MIPHPPSASSSGATLCRSAVAAIGVAGFRACGAASGGGGGGGRFDAECGGCIGTRCSCGVGCDGIGAEAT